MATFKYNMRLMCMDLVSVQNACANMRFQRQEQDTSLFISRFNVIDTKKYTHTHTLYLTNYNSLRYTFCTFTL